MSETIGLPFGSFVVTPAMARRLQIWHVEDLVRTAVSRDGLSLDRELTEFFARVNAATKVRADTRDLANGRVGRVDSDGCDTFLSAAEAARRLGVSAREVRRKIVGQELIARRGSGGSWSVDPLSVDEYLEHRSRRRRTRGAR